MPTIGLPKALFYYQHSVLWENFFQNLGCRVVVSSDTNKQILDSGVTLCSSETCLPVKVFHGHVHSLMNRADYIFVPRYTSVRKDEFTCPKFCALPEVTLINLKKQVKLLTIDINANSSQKNMCISLREMARELKLNFEFAVKEFKDAFDKHANHADGIAGRLGSYSASGEREPSIAVLGHPYMIFDEYINMKLIKKLRSRKLAVYFPSSLNYSQIRENAFPYQGRVFWEAGLDNLGSAFTFARYKNIRGIIYLTPFACGVDSFVTELIERRIRHISSMPFIKLTIDEHSGEAGFDTRVEAFLDMVGRT
ncbi:MAG: acyl-CoA dehydratase activase-related protein [Clostridia bacterium]|nr:acyl-CoA dehydratase activase-related protein [Clostridia bacterium]